MPRIWLTVTTPVPPMPIMCSSEAVGGTSSAGSGRSASGRRGSSRVRAWAPSASTATVQERRAVAQQAGVVLVARRLVDARLAPELGLDRLHARGSSTSRRSRRSPRRPRSLMNTRVGGSASLPRLRRRRFSAAHCWSWISTVTPGRRRELALRPRAGRSRCADVRVAPSSRPRYFAGSSAVTTIRLHALGREPAGERGNGQRARCVLAAGHRHGGVVEDLVGDVDAGGDRAA